MVRASCERGGQKRREKKESESHGEFTGAGGNRPRARGESASLGNRGGRESKSPACSCRIAHSS
jgi:hypothetical protein